MASGWAKMVRIAPSDHLQGALGDLGEHGAQDAHPAALPGRADQDRPDGLLQPFVGARDHQLHPDQAAGL
ncbi:hypothetical protein TH66_06665 [Carbonactinospora thermoautotrophica]|uniref:Uncharacterized protein n=1 Tax=Carbonactinospora thermoautotrophica TaxID=1469144 RepID=A0A132NJA4_9ACTN|nr:hypothetical protein TH66_06665 [Carbonactinospora thermoautotrophica]KWX10241.1 hypothetical protein TR74_04810 [Carbonactinospora thermoautotrophica]